MSETLEKETKQVRVWLPKEEYAAIMEMKYREKKVDTPIGDYILDLVRSGVEAKAKKF